jgi:sigma-B regulation protein RsbU (phosphoserine phosphatase)
VFPPFSDLTDKLDIFASMTPAKDVGGDFYDFFRIDDDRIGFVIADVSGKGIPAAIFMAVSRTLIRATGIRGGSPAECISYSNKLLAGESVDCMFVTVFYGILNTTTGEIVYCNAGHNPPYVLKRNGQVEALPMSQDPMVGAIDGIEYHEGRLMLEKSDALVMFTDGVTEAMNVQNEEFGEERLEDTLAEVTLHNCQQMVEAIKADVAAFAGEAEQSDDITVLTLKRL